MHLQYKTNVLSIKFYLYWSFCAFISRQYCTYSPYTIKKRKDFYITDIIFLLVFRNTQRIVNCHLQIFAPEINLSCKWRHKMVQTFKSFFIIICKSVLLTFLKQYKSEGNLVSWFENICLIWLKDSWMKTQ